MMITKNQHITVSYEGVERSGTVLSATKGGFFGQFVTIILDTPFVHKNSANGTVMRTIALHVKR